MEAKKVRVFLGEGGYRQEIGTAEFEEREDGRFLVNMNISGETAEKLGLGMDIKGILPALPWKEY
jgi:hypothetical protein